MKKTIFIFIAISSFFSCNNQKKQINQRWDYYQNTRDTLLNETILKQAKDTVQKWIDLDINYWAFNRILSEVKWVEYCFLNTLQTKGLFYLKQRDPKGPGGNFLRTVIGEKHEGNWWFYPDPAIYIKRNKNAKGPMNWQELKKTARRIAMGWYYKEERKSFGDCNNFLLEFDFDGYNQCRKLNYTINDVAFESEFSTKSRTEEYDEPHERIEGYLQWISNPENKYIPEKK